MTFNDDEQCIFMSKGVTYVPAMKFQKYEPGPLSHLPHGQVCYGEDAEEKVELTGSVKARGVLSEIQIVNRGF